MKITSKKNIKKNRKSKKDVRKNKRSRKNVGKYSRKNVMRGGELNEIQKENIEKLKNNEKLLTNINIYEANEYDYLIEILKALETNRTLKELEIHNTSFLTDFTKVLELTEALTKVLKVNKTLTKLRVNHINMRGYELNEKETQIIDQLKKNDMHLDTLESVQDNYIYLIEIIKALEKNHTLKKLKISDNSFENDIVKVLALAIALTEALKVNKTLTTLNFSNNNLSNVGIEKIAQALETNTSLTSLNISESYRFNGYYFNHVIDGDEGAKAIAKALEINKTLKELDISYNLINKEGLTALALALQKNTSLETLVINYNNPYNPTDDRNLIKDESYAQLVNNTTLKKLDISHNDIGKYKAHFLDFSQSKAHALGEALKKNTTLTTLNISSCSIETEFAKIAEALKENKDSALTTLDISRNRIQAKGAIAIAKALEKNKTLTELNISWNNIGVEGAKAIAKALEINSTLTTLNISNSYNNISIDGATALADMLKTNTSLKTVDISLNNISVEGAQAIATALQKNNTLTELNIRRTNINIAGAQAIATALQNNTTLTTLNISENNIVIKGTQAIATALQKNNTLTKLYISSNYIGVEGAQAIAEALQTNITLKTLYISDNQINDDGVTALSKALETNKENTLTTFYIIKNNIGVKGAIAIAGALQGNETLTTLDIDGNKIGDEGAKAIAEALRTNKILTTLNISNNKINYNIHKEIDTLIMKNIKYYETQQKHISNRNMSSKISNTQSLHRIFKSLIDEGYKLSENYNEGLLSIKNSSNNKKLNQVKKFINSLEVNMNNKTKKTIMALKNSDEGIKTAKAIIFNIPYYIYLKEHKDIDKNKLLEEYRKYIQSIIMKDRPSGYTNYTSPPKDIPILPQEMWELILTFLDINITKNLLDSFKLNSKTLTKTNKLSNIESKTPLITKLKKLLLY